MAFKILECYIISCFERDIEPSWEGLKEFRNGNKEYI